MPEIEILPDSEALTARAAGNFIHLAEEALRTRGRFMVALAGGSTPQKMYALLTGAKLDWRGIHIFWGDERCVPANHADSNYRMVADVLLNQISIPPENVHRIQGELPPEEAALAYEIEMCNAFNDESPRFDLILLGLGSDGHTASLFPGTPALLEKYHWVTAVPHESPPPPLVDRVTLTLRVINAAAHITFIVSGSDKAEVVSRVLRDPTQPGLLPAQLVKPVNGNLHWLVDRSAARGIASVTELHEEPVYE